MAGVRVEGLDKLVADLGNASRDVKRKMNDAVKKAATNCMEDAQRLVPVRTGRTRDSIVVKRRAASIYDVEADAFWAYWVEYGNAHSAPQAFMGPAFDLQQPRFVDDMKNVIEELF